MLGRCLGLMSQKVSIKASSPANCAVAWITLHTFFEVGAGISRENPQISLHRTNQKGEGRRNRENHRIFPHPGPWGQTSLGLRKRHMSGAEEKKQAQLLEAKSGRVKAVPSRFF